MNIRIAQRFHPFSHRPGAICLIPFSTWAATIYPTRILLQHMDDKAEKLTLDLDILGPVKEFTIELDLERGLIRVFGHAMNGYLRYELQRVDEGILLTFQKTPSSHVSCTLHEKGAVYQLTARENLLLSVPNETAPVAIPTKRLSLGLHKKQDWEMVLRRFDLKEILPIIMRLGEMIPFQAHQRDVSGTLSLLNAFEAACNSHNKLEAQACCEQWLRASFTDLLLPALEDPLFQGIIPPCKSGAKKSLALRHLTEGSRLILSLFFKENERGWEILPCLLPLFHSGRLIDLTTQSEEKISMEWSKHQLKKVAIQTHLQRIQSLSFPKEIRSFRLRKSLREKGKTILAQGGRVDLNLPANSQLLLDCFKK